MRLYGSFGSRGSPEDVSGDISMSEKGGSEFWSKRLTDRANELSISIQNIIQSKQLESTSDSANDIGVDHREQVDAKRMETVLFLCNFRSSLRWYYFLFELMVSCFISLQIFHFMIAGLKSGRASVLLDLIIELMYPVLSLQVNILVILP